MASKIVLSGLLVLSALCLIEAQLKRDSVQVRPPPPVIRIPPPPPPPKVRSASYSIDSKLTVNFVV
ncbi:unnamed protein product [Ixodes persulcatus]